MKIFVFLLAIFGAIFDALALALHLQNVALVAKFANANLQASLVFVLVGEARSSNFHNDDLVDEVAVVEVH